jgi:seryl-tRNA synthetase
MWERIKNNFDNGIRKLKWFSSALSDRLKIEISVMRLLHQSEQLGEKRDELMKTIGQRVFELRGQPERSIMNDSIISEALSEIERINSEMEATKKKASEISKIEP